MSCWLRDRFLGDCPEGDAVVLDLPDVRQSTGWGCGEAAARIVLQFFGAKGRKPLASPIDGTDPRGLETAIWLAGLSVQAGQMDVADLKYHTARGRPVVALVTEPSGTGHYVVVGGVRHRAVWFADPLDGMCREPVASFEERWRDVDRLGVRYVRWGIAVSG